MTKLISGLLANRMFLAIVSVAVLSGAAAGQRAGSAAQGGSIRPDALQERRKDPVTSASPSPGYVTTVSAEECVDGECPGNFYLTYGFNFNRSPRGGGSSTMRAGFAFTAYLHRRVFVEIDSDNVTSAKPETGERVTGYGDTTFYLGADLLLGTKKYEPGVTIMYGVKAPTASATKGLGSGKVDHTILAAFTKGFGETTSFEFDIGNTWAGRPEGGGFDVLPFASVILKQKLDRKKLFTLKSEFTGTFKTKNYEGDAYNLTYLESEITPYFSLRTGAKLGITDNLTRAGLYIGLRFNGNLKKLF